MCTSLTASEGLVHFTPPFLECVEVVLEVFCALQMYLSYSTIAVLCPFVTLLILYWKMQHVTPVKRNGAVQISLHIHKAEFCPQRGQKFNDSSQQVRGVAWPNELFLYLMMMMMMIRFPVQTHQVLWSLSQPMNLLRIPWHCVWGQSGWN